MSSGSQKQNNKCVVKLGVGLRGHRPLKASETGQRKRLAALSEGLFRFANTGRGKASNLDHCVIQTTPGSIKETLPLYRLRRSRVLTDRNRTKLIR